jgi:hypothetical protein
MCVQVCGVLSCFAELTVMHLEGSQVSLETGKGCQDLVGPMFSSPVSVTDVWGREIWPKIEQDYKKLLSSPPVTQVDGAIGAAFTQDKILEKVRLTGEARGYTGVLAWFQPLQGPDCQTFTIAMVDKCVSAYFRDAEGELRVPDLWWRGLNVPISLKSKAELPPKGSLVILF